MGDARDVCIRAGRQDEEDGSFEEKMMRCVDLRCAKCRPSVEACVFTKSDFPRI